MNNKTINELTDLMTKAKKIETIENFLITNTKLDVFDKEDSEKLLKQIKPLYDVYDECIEEMFDILNNIKEGDNYEKNTNSI